LLSIGSLGVSPGDPSLTGWRRDEPGRRTYALVRRGDELNGFDAEAVVTGLQETAEWLRAGAVRHYPASEFARLFARPANERYALMCVCYIIPH